MVERGARPEIGPVPCRIRGHDQGLWAWHVRKEKGKWPEHHSMPCESQAKPCESWVWQNTVMGDAAGPRGHGKALGVVPVP